MKTKFFKSIVTIFFLLCSSTASICLGKEYITEEDIWTSNINDKAINIKVTDIAINNTSIELDEVYNASAIITVDVKNNGLNDIELANLDVYPYQGSLATKYFVSTYKDEISGFIGNLKSGESKTLKMGVTLHNTKEPIRLEFSDIEDIRNTTIVKTIDIKKKRKANAFLFFTTQVEEHQLDIHYCMYHILYIYFHLLCICHLLQICS